MGPGDTDGMGRARTIIRLAVARGPWAGLTLVAVVGSLAGLTACGDESTTGETSAPTTAAAAPPAQPFRIDGVPEGFTLTEAGRGTSQPE